MTALFRFERRYGTFTRAVGLPQGVDTDKISAEYRDGVLEVHVPKPEEQKPKRITLGGNGEGRHRRRLDASRLTTANRFDQGGLTAASRRKLPHARVRRRAQRADRPRVRGLAVRRVAVSYDAQTLPQLAAHFYRQAVEERTTR